jgi:PadR family transcriptional regulator, regulatory protein AphA
MVPRALWDDAAMAGRTTTSYALLGLLHVRPWTTYELAKQVRRSLNWFWPRAERKLYDEPKALAADGLATATERFTGKRRSREYEITEEGRAALQAWLSEPPEPHSWEFEGILKLFFCDAGELDQLNATLDAIEAEALRRIAALGEMAGEPNRFPERAHISALGLPLQLEQEKAVLAWARWARRQVAQWKSTRDPGSWDADSVNRSLAQAAAQLVPSTEPLPEAEPTFLPG